MHKNGHACDPKNGESESCIENDGEFEFKLFEIREAEG